MAKLAGRDNRNSGSGINVDQIASANSRKRRQQLYKKQRLGGRVPWCPYTSCVYSCLRMAVPVTWLSQRSALARQRRRGRTAREGVIGPRRAPILTLTLEAFRVRRKELLWPGPAADGD